MDGALPNPRHICISKTPPGSLAACFGAALEGALPEPRRRTAAWVSSTYGPGSADPDAQTCSAAYHVRVLGYQPACVRREGMLRLHAFSSGMDSPRTFTRTCCRAVRKLLMVFAKAGRLFRGLIFENVAVHGCRWPRSAGACCLRRQSRQCRTARCCWRWGRTPCCGGPCAKVLALALFLTPAGCMARHCPDGMQLTNRANPALGSWGHGWFVAKRMHRCSGLHPHGACPSCCMAATHTAAVRGTAILGALETCPETLSRTWFVVLAQAAPTWCIGACAPQQVLHAVSACTVHALSAA